MRRLQFRASFESYGLRFLAVMVIALGFLDSVAFAQISVPNINGGGGTPTNNNGTSTSVCPVRLIGRVEDIDGSGNLICRYKIFIASNCGADEYRVDLQCNVNKVDCINGSCANPNVSTLIPVSPPDPKAASNDINDPIPNPMPVNDPNTIPGYYRAFASSSLNGGIVPVPAGSTRTIVPIGANTTATVKYAKYTEGTVDKYFKLIRLEITEADGSKKTLGSGFEIPSLPATETVVPTVFRSMQAKTFQVEEYSNTGNVEWTYIVHEST